MTIQSRLYKLKHWLTLEDAAAHLSTMLSEPVTEVDILELCIQKRLKLSVNVLVPTNAQRGVIVDSEEAYVGFKSPDSPPERHDNNSHPTESLEEKLTGMPEVKIKDIKHLDEEIKSAIKDQRITVCLISQKISNTEFVEFGEEIELIKPGVYDLPMLSAEAYAVDEVYYRMIDGPQVDRWSLEGAWLEDDGDLLRLCTRMKLKVDSEMFRKVKGYGEWPVRYWETSDWVPSDELPEESILVVRRQNLDAFIANLEQEQEPRQDVGGEVERTLEAFGLLVELYASQHGLITGMATDRKHPALSRICLSQSLMTLPIWATAS
ncbi:hypothetical protein [Halomonas sp. BC04]|uniref:hypothetical protein n=1 Tax=Halomonas sp. BC04 TaxID=1403540 RepID=UPI0003ED7319|nr:hypothetical protein [Halomonas sp. BC04]EWH00596.1 hypothetical protein Q427_18680 [Halomonas sp. BC04]